MPSEKPDFLKIILPFTMSVMCIISYSVFNEHWFFSLQEYACKNMLACSFVRLYSYTNSRLYPCKTYQNGLKWTRTTDLALIRRAL